MDWKKITPARRKALMWIAKHEPVSAFPADGSGASLMMTRRLRTMGLVEECGREPGMWGCTKFRLSELGRAALSAPSTDAKVPG